MQHTPRRRGRPKKLSQGCAAAKLRKTITDVLSLGGSRVDAAIAAGVDRSTISEQEKRDPEFARALARAELAGKIIALRTVHGIMQSKDEAVAFKAASWFLAVKHWRDWAKRNPDAIKPDEVVRLIQHAFEGVLNRVPAKYHDAIRAWFDEVAAGMRKRK